MKTSWKFLFLLWGVLLFLPLAPVNAGTINVPAGGDLQLALNSAQPGDLIILQAGASFVGNFYLPYKTPVSGTDSDYITVRTSSPDSSLPGPDQRITPGHSGVLARIITPGNGLSAIRTVPSTHH